MLDIADEIVNVRLRTLCQVLAVNAAGSSHPGMDTNIPANCPSCATGGIRSSVRLYQINLDEAAVFCENPTCPFPLFSQDVCPLVVTHAVSTRSAANSLPKSKTRSVDTDSVASSCSASSWTSNASTVSSISSSMATPPPTISSKPFSWPSNPSSLVYQPKAVIAQKQKHPFDWTSPISSAQSSPASSIISVNDREVELVMKKSSYLSPNSGLTPSPSPLLSEILDTRASQPPDEIQDIDSYIESFSFLEEITRPSEPAQSSSTACQDTQPNVSESTRTYVDLSTTTKTIAHTPTEEQKTKVSTSKLGKRPNKATELGGVASKRRSKDDSSPELTRSSTTTSESTPVFRVIQSNGLPPKQKQVRSRKPRVKKPVSFPVDSSEESASPLSSTATTPQTLVPKQQVAVDINADGTPVFIIHPVTPLPLASPQPTPAKKTSNTPVGSRGRKTASNKTSESAVKRKVDGVKKRTKPDPFCIESLVKRFVEAAKNKKLPADPKAS